jgi:hypothetical protein
LEGDAVNGFRERIEQIQAKIKQEKSRLRGDHPFNPLQKSVDSFPPAKRLSARLDAQLILARPNSFRVWLAQSKALVSGSTELAEVPVEPFCYSTSRLINHHSI